MAEAMEYMELDGFVDQEQMKEALRGYHIPHYIRTKEGRYTASSSQIKAWGTVGLPIKETASMSKGTKIHAMAERLMHERPVRIIEQARAGSKLYQNQVDALEEGDILVTKSDVPYFNQCLEQIRRFRVELPDYEHIHTEQMYVREGHHMFYRWDLDMGMRALVDLVWTGTEKDGPVKIYDWKTSSKRTLRELEQEIKYRGYGYSAWHYVETLKGCYATVDPVVTFVFLLDKSGAPVQIEYNTQNPELLTREIMPCLERITDRRRFRDYFNHGHGGPFVYGEKYL